MRPAPRFTFAFQSSLPVPDAEALRDREDRVARARLDAITPPAVVEAQHRALLAELAAVEAQGVALERLGATIASLGRAGVDLGLGDTSAQPSPSP